MAPIKVETIQSLTDEGTLHRVLGPIASVTRDPMGTVGYSGSTHERLDVQLQMGARRSLVFKHVVLDRDWTAYRTGDTLGREAALLGESTLEGIWDIFTCPYLAYAVREGEFGLLMNDLSDSLLPDVNVPISREEEDTLLRALAKMHARYWNSGILELPWLTSPAQLLAVLGPAAGEQEATRAPSHPLFAMVDRGWKDAMSRVPDAVKQRLLTPVHELLHQYADLPKTVIHGDAKVANFALLSDGGVAAFDWAWVGAGACTLDLGWYLAVNAGRLARPKEKVIARYRSFLEIGLRERLPDNLWERLVKMGILSASLMLLWAKTLDLETGSQDAIREWQWWVDRLGEIR